jgi:hypothetical protein
MVKANRRPCLIAMTVSAVILWIIFFINMALMNVFMAICTGIPHIPKGPSIGTFIHMAGKTRRSQMAPLQRKPGLLVLLKGVETVIKAFFKGMAGRAIRITPIFPEFSIMIISMTTGTCRKIDWR